MNRIASLLLTLLLGGCGTPLVVMDETPLPPTEAHVVIYPYYRFGKAFPADIEIQFTRIIDAKRRSSTFLRNIPNNAVTVIALEPGVYFVSQLNSGNHYYRHRSEGLDSLFEVRSGQLNYPGSWRLIGTVHDSWVSGTVFDGAASMTYSLDFSVREDAGVVEQLKVTHPKIAARLPFRFTWVDLRDRDAVRRVGQ